MSYISCLCMVCLKHVFAPQDVAAVPKKGNFLLRISLVDVTKLVGNCEFGHIY